MTEETLQDTLSTVITEAPQAGGAGAGTPPAETGDENLSIAEVLRKEADAQKAEAKTKEKAEPEPEPKPTILKEPKAEEEAKEKEVLDPKKVEDEAGEKETAKAAQSEGKADRIPSRLLPKEREVWANVPNAVKSAWERMEAEHTSASEKYEASAKFHEELREYDEMAKAAKTDIKTALDRYVSMDKKIAANFGEGVADIARAFNKNPVEAVAQFMRAAGVMPQQLGAYLQGQPAQAAQQQQSQAQRAPDPVAQRALQEVAQLRQQLQQQQAETEHSKIESDIVSPFADSHPRFAELQNDIVFFLNSGKVPASLSPVERLEVAYDMAERINPSSVMTSPSLAEPAGKPASDAGKKSVRGAPASGKSKDADFEDETDLVALLRREARKLTA